ncbi:Phytanoyl-CoA dioxygenase (PhyH) [Geodermatophilus obscurus]|uniref:Phytanoyl-CoA dioxygenase (PhyH) n=1 Tax=Geodermatophilus obscurus TaxID=1861 RepID=A0A1M7S2M9_9ACTN|nr:phytanoyl-CoA dioxygenase family protein [Geodermatophilus obscurus]SHN52718.1 Phytanoyl-CoA dioxygenase (PhyH) [Geodermatophilus obscurus]
MSLTSHQRLAYQSDGAVIRRGFVSAHLVARAVELIDEWYRRSMNPAELVSYTQRTFAPELGSHPDLLALFTDSGAAELAGNLLGAYAPVRTVQVQIRVPEAQLAQPQPIKDMHVDGVACPHLDPTELRTFSLLVGVLLSEVSDPAQGALRYVPGGHLTMADWFSREWRQGVTQQTPPHVAANEGVPLLGAPGDLLLMHHLVPHAVGPNHGTSPRIMAYFRVSHVDHAGRRLDALRDPWLDYPALIPPARRARQDRP